MSPAPTLDLLRDRASLLKKARAFFDARGLLEVDCSCLRSRAPIDANIDVISATVSKNEIGYLHTSPEYGMKQILSSGSQDIFFLGHVFRQGDIGRIHNPEFTMAEWYRIGIPFSQIIEETCDFLFLFSPPLKIQILSYREAFARYVGIDYTRAPISQLQASVRPFATSFEHWDRSTYIHCLLAHLIEPKLGIGELTVLTDYPPEEAALARLIQKNGELVAERFEIYIQGIELANGYHELTDAAELRRRFEENNRARSLANKEPYLLDEEFLSSVEGLPDCCGVSVGFDRAFMLRRNAPSLNQVLPFGWP